MKRQLVCIAALLWISTAAHGAEPAKPEVMFVINTAGSMQRAPDAQGALTSLRNALRVPLAQLTDNIVFRHGYHSERLGWCRQASSK